MSRRRSYVGVAAALAMAATIDVAAISEPKGNNLSSGRSVIASGGGTSAGGGFEISGTIGQADADPLQPSMGGDFAITGGFWPSLAPTTDLMYRDGFEGP